MLGELRRRQLRLPRRESARRFDASSRPGAKFGLPKPIRGCYEGPALYLAVATDQFKQLVAEAEGLAAGDPVAVFTLLSRMMATGAAAETRRGCPPGRRRTPSGPRLRATGPAA